jgi:ribosomal protein L11 methyltransferase
MSWLRIQFVTGRDESDRIADALEAAGAISVSFESECFDQLLERYPRDTPLWPRVRVTGLYPADIDVSNIYRSLKHSGIADCGHGQIETVEDQDWERSWMDEYAPIHIGGSLWICPSWCVPPETSAVNVVLDPGLAFGTGTHPSTALCLAWLQQQVLNDRVVIDYGCGSGILAIAAIKLGARSAIGIDTDPRALEVSRENAVRNNVADRIQVFPSGSLPETCSADIVIANILAQTLIDLAPQLCDLVRSGGFLALSGILEPQIGDVRGSFSKLFDLNAEIQDEWALLAGPKRETPLTATG